MTIVCNEFDERIKDPADVQSFKQYDNKYIKKSGYFSDSMCRFQNLNDCFKDTLVNISNNSNDGDYIFETAYGTCYRFFIPESLLKKEKLKKYRAFSLNEFLDLFSIGDVVHFRSKGSSVVKHMAFTGYETHDDGSLNVESGAADIVLGGHYVLDHLFNHYELFLNHKWQPFGIKED